VNRDNALFLLVGLLAGFLVGYLAHEAMAGVQPQRLAAGAATDPHAAAGPAPGGGQMADLAALRETLEREPENREALLALANMNFDIGAWARAQELYERYLRLDPENADVLTDLGICLRSQGQIDAALERFREARRLRPTHWQSLYNEVVVHAFDRKDFAAAEPVLAELVRQAGDSPEVQRLVAEIERLKSAP
jgi:tetratricopeptide (TPR) repeat protein